jgi:hypothetical protein
MERVMDALRETDLSEVEERVSRALEVAPAPWIPLLETRHGIGGCSFIQVGDDPALDIEIYVDVHVGTGKLTSPDRRLDAVIDFLGHAPADVIRLTAEVRRLRNELA